MNIKKYVAGLLLSACLAMLLGIPRAEALTGPEIAQLLNRAWNSTPGQCVDGHAAYYCSGVMLKQISPGDPAPFWSHGPDAIARGAERFDYLRRDITPGPLTQASGYIFADRFTALGQGKDYQLLGDDGMGRPPELLVRNWGALPPGQLPVLAVYHDMAQPSGLGGALRNQRAWFESTGEWLPVLRLDSRDTARLSFGFALKEQVYLGYQVVDRLNRRYGDTAATCADGAAAYYCNGVLIRGTVPGPIHSWNPKPNAYADKGVSFSYLREDLDSRIIYYAQGFIFRELSVPVSHPVTLRCAYAGDAATGPPDRCRVDCSLLGIHTLTDYRRVYPNRYARDCSLGPGPQAFHLNNEVRFNQTWTAGVWNEIIIAPWPLDIPTQLPLEAFFYNWAQPAGVAGAQYIQRDYAQVTGGFLPIVLIDLTAAPGHVFSFDPAVQSL